MEGLSAPSAIAPESAADQSLRQRQKLARTVGIIAALALIALALVITLFLQRFGLGILAVFVGGPLATPRTWPSRGLLYPGSASPSWHGGCRRSGR